MTDDPTPEQLRRATIQPNPGALLPLAITIGRYIYTVTDDPTQWADRTNDGVVNGATQFGASNHTKLLIILNPIQHPLQKADTLLHEVLHCVWFLAQAGSMRDLKDDADLEEYVVSHLATPLVDVLTSNPGLLAYLQNPT